MMLRQHANTNSTDEIQVTHSIVSHSVSLNQSPLAHNQPTAPSNKQTNNPSTQYSTSQIYYRMKRTFSLALIAAAVAPSATAFAPPSTITCRNTYCQDTFSRFSSKVFMSDDDDVSNE
jgi:hypothetical protein